MLLPIAMLRSSYFVLWLVQPLLKAAIVGFMFRRKLHLRHPLFFSFVTYSLAVNLLLYTLRDSYKTYFYAYWSTNAVALLLSLGVIYELFTAMFRQHHALRDFGSLLFRWAGVIVVLMAGLLIYSTTGVSPNRLVNAVVNVERAVTMMQCGMLMFLMVFYRHLGISSRHQLFGIAFGLGSWAAVDLLLASNWLRGMFSQSGYNLLHMITYNYMLVTWLVYMLMPAQESAPQLLLKPQRWNEALLDASNPANGPVLMGIEDIVDRTLKGSRKHVGSA